MGASEVAGCGLQRRWLNGDDAGGGNGNGTICKRLGIERVR